MSRMTENTSDSAISLAIGFGTHQEAKGRLHLCLLIIYNRV